MAYFMSLGISINSTNNAKSTAIHWSAFVGGELSISFVIAWGADVNSQDNLGKTPLHLAVKNFK
jgi:ankyrin repeat protein